MKSMTDTKKKKEEKNGRNPFTLTRLNWRERKCGKRERASIFREQARDEDEERNKKN